MERPKVVITHRVHDDVIDVLRPRCEVLINSTNVAWQCSEVLERSKDASALMVFMSDCINADFLDKCPNLRIVAGVLKGFDNFDVDACTKRGVWLTTVPN